MGCCDPVYSEREPAIVHRLVEVVADLECEGMIVILSEADLQHSGPMVDRIVLIDRGTLTARG